MMRSMIRSHYTSRIARSTPLLAHKGHKLSPAYEINVCNGDLVMTITEVIAGNIIPTNNHLILSEDILDQALIN
jgi:hypothetical protein